MNTIQNPPAARQSEPVTCNATTIEIDVFDRYADAIIAGRIDQFDAIEIHGVRDQNARDCPTGTACEVDDENPEFFSVYVHLHEGGVDCVGDFTRFGNAEQYAGELAAQYGWPVRNFVPSSARDLVGKISPLQ